MLLYISIKGSCFADTGLRSNSFHQYNSWSKNERNKYLNTTPIGGISSKLGYLHWFLKDTIITSGINNLEILVIDKWKILWFWPVKLCLQNSEPVWMLGNNQPYFLFSYKRFKSVKRLLNLVMHLYSFFNVCFSIFLKTTHIPVTTNWYWKCSGNLIWAHFSAFSYHFGKRQTLRFCSWNCVFANILK